MKLQTLCWVAMLAALLLLAPLAMAQYNDLYDNGPIDGYTMGWTINYGYAVSDQFTLSRDSTVFGIQFGAWLSPGDVLQTAEVSVTSSEFGGTSYFDQIVSFSQGHCFSNGGVFNVCTETASFNFGFDLADGSYWLTLQNATVSNNDPAYWDQNGGPSLASESSVGTIPSESFTILGSSGTSCGECGCGNHPDCGPPPTSPEPGSWLLSGSGAVLLIKFLRALRHK